MDTIKNIEKTTTSILEELAGLDVNVDNTDVVAKLDSILTALTNLDVTSVPVVDPLVTLFDATVLPKSPDAGYTVTSTAFDTNIVKKLWVFGANATGTSTTIAINALSTANSTNPVPLAVMTLNATTTVNGGYCITDLPPFVQVKITNNDTINAATVTVKYVNTR